MLITFFILIVILFFTKKEEAVFNLLGMSAFITDLSMIVLLWEIAIFKKQKPRKSKFLKIKILISFLICVIVNVAIGYLLGPDIVLIYLFVALLLPLIIWLSFKLIK